MWGGDYDTALYETKETEEFEGNNSRKWLKQVPVPLQELLGYARMVDPHVYKLAMEPDFAYNSNHKMSKPVEKAAGMWPTVAVNKDQLDDGTCHAVYSRCHVFRERRGFALVAVSHGLRFTQFTTL